jgi:quercetin dioxygenase-like cupin family protein
MKTIQNIPNQNAVKFVPSGTGPMYCGPGDKVTFLLTGEQSGGACFIFEVMVPPGGGPMPHIHRNEDESFYLLEGTLTIQAGGRSYQASPGDFIRLPRGVAHSFKNNGNANAKMVVTISPGGPGGTQKFFEEAFYPTTDRLGIPALVTEDLMERMKAALTRHGLELAEAA